MEVNEFSGALLRSVRERGFFDDGTMPIADIDTAIVQQAIWNVVEATEILEHLVKRGLRDPLALWDEVADNVVTTHVLAGLVGIRDVEAVTRSKVMRDEMRGIRHRQAAQVDQDDRPMPIGEAIRAVQAVAAKLQREESTDGD